MWRFHVYMRSAYLFILKMATYLMRLFIDPKGANLNLEYFNFKSNSKGHLTIGGCDAVNISKEYGTPLFVVDEEKLRSNYKQFCNAFESSYPKVNTFYSYKTNPLPGVLKILHNEGAGAEVISPYELWLAMHLGVSPDRIVYNGVYKDYESIEIAVKNGIRLINIDSFKEIEMVAAIAKRFNKRPNIGIRVSTGFGWESQFGFQITTGEAFQAFQKASDAACLNVSGMHTHLGTGIKDISEYKQAVTSMINLSNKIKQELNLNIDVLDLGGGFGVPTVRYLWEGDKFFSHPVIPDVKKSPRMDQFAKEITDTIRNECNKYDIPLPHLFLEPGRAITSNAQILLLSVATVKKRFNGKLYIIADGGLGIAYPLTWEYHELFIANRINEQSTCCYTVVGPLCTPSDLLYKSKFLPEAFEGDVLAIMDAGAYFISYMNTFSFPRPGVAVACGGKIRQIRIREEFKMLTSLDLIAMDQ